MSIEEWGVETESERCQADSYQSTPPISKPPLAQIPLPKFAWLRPRALVLTMPEDSMSDSEAALMRDYLWAWKELKQQPYRISREGQVMAISRQLRTQRFVNWAQLYGGGEGLQLQEQARPPYVVGPSRRPVASLSEMWQWMAEAASGGEGLASVRQAAGRRGGVSQQPHAR